MAKTFDPYRALGLRRDATDKEVKAAHRRLAKRFHPDAANGNTERFLDIQEAYRVLSDPLLRREWDVGHAPGPIRADRPAPKREPRPRRPAGPADAERETRGARPDSDSESAEAEPAARRPRSSRAYTWSAADVPWWEEGASENRRQSARRRRPATGTNAAPDVGDRDARGKPEAPPPDGPTPEGPPTEAPNSFDVYNRSSGAAWSMAARAYFRRGDQDLPRRGTFHYEGTQVLTAARARAAAENEARRRQAHHRNEAAAASAQATTFDSLGLRRARDAARRGAGATSWPSLPERLLYALLAWIPVAIAIGYGGAVATGCDGGSLTCPAYLETSQTVGIAIALGVLVALPKVAYVGTLAAAGALLIGLVVVGFLAAIGAQLPLPESLVALVASSLLLGYASGAAFVLARSPATRPWSADPGAGSQ